MASLRYIVDHGGVITDAVSSQKWPGEAKVHVSITNWVKSPSENIGDFYLDGAPVEGINPKLQAGVTLPESFKLPQNRGKAFIGCQPTGDGFIVSDEVAADLIAAGEGQVVRRYVTSDDLADVVGAQPGRWIIDFGTMPLEGALRFPKSIKIVREKVRPHREGKERHFARLWWQFAWPRPEMRKALTSKSRYIISTLTGKRLLFAWASIDWCPSNKVGVFALDDDYSMGILCSNSFSAWAWNESATMKADLLFTPSTAFETFPWPFPSPEKREVVARAAQTLIERRQQIAQADLLGLTDLYNRVDEGAYAELVNLHNSLDAAVVACYGWPKEVARDRLERLRLLGDLNQSLGGRGHGATL
ncbi:type IIL restriction-modification enzyme MmeI [Streptomyces sp. 900105755]